MWCKTLKNVINNVQESPIPKRKHKSEDKTYPRGRGRRVKIVIEVIVARWSIWLRGIPGSSVKRSARRIVRRRH